MRNGNRQLWHNQIANSRGNGEQIPSQSRSKPDRSGFYAMVYALNVFTLIPGKEEQYKEYSVKAGKVIYGLGGRVVASGHDPLRHMHGDLPRQIFIVVEFPGEGVFQQMVDELDRQNLHTLREGATKDYIWTLYQAWDLRAWVREGGKSDA
jgi:uncharacterized protein (DUF1330 family)